MAHNVEDGPTWVDYKEAANAPRLVSKRVDNFEVALNGTCVHLVNVGDLDAHIWQQR